MAVWSRVGGEAGRGGGHTYPTQRQCNPYTIPLCNIYTTKNPNIGRGMHMEKNMQVQMIHNWVKVLLSGALILNPLHLWLWQWWWLWLWRYHGTCCHATTYMPEHQSHP